MFIHLRTLFLFLILIIANSSATDAQAAAPVYVTLGPEAPAILRMLIGKELVLPVTTTHLAEFLHNQSITAVIAPEEWLDNSQLDAVRAKGVRLVLIKRHTSVANMIDNIRTLATLTDTEDMGKRWLASIEQGISEIQKPVAGQRLTRVLILTPEGYTQGQGALITELIGIAGGINVAAEAEIPEARQIDDQQVRSFAPEVVLLINWTAGDARQLADNEVLAGVSAFQEHHLYRVEMPGKDPAALVLDLQRLADLLHPPLL